MTLGECAETLRDPSVCTRIHHERSWETERVVAMMTNRRVIARRLVLVAAVVFSLWSVAGFVVWLSIRNDPVSDWIGLNDDWVLFVPWVLAAVALWSTYVALRRRSIGRPHSADESHLR